MKLITLCLLLSISALLPLHPQGLREQLKGLVFEAEDWSEPKDACLKDKDTPDRWNLWTTEEDVERKRSRGASLRSPVIREDRRSPNEGAPPLHTRITGIPHGSYRVFLSNPTRAIAYSFDSKEWLRGEPRGEIFLGVFDVRNGIFELWVDDRFATPANVGPCYYDYVRMEAYTPPQLSHFAAYRQPDGQVQVSWISSEQMDTGVLEADTGSSFKPVAESSEKALRNHQVSVHGWKSAQQIKLRVRAQMGPRYTFTSQTVELQLPTAPPQRSPVPQRIPLQLASPPTTEQPVLMGLPLPPKQLYQAEHAWVEGARGAVGNGRRAVPSQVSISARWSDGSAKWLFVRFLPQGDAQAHFLRIGDKPPPTSNPFRIKGDRSAQVSDRAKTPDRRSYQSGDQRSDNGQGRRPSPIRAGRDAPPLLAITNGRLRMRLHTKSFALFEEVEDMGGADFTGKPLLGNVRLVDGEGSAWGLGTPERLEIEESGPVRAVVRAEGRFQNEAGGQRFRYRLRYFLTANSPLVRVQLTLINDAVDVAFTPLKSFAFRIPVAGEGQLRGQLANGEQVTVTEPEGNWIQQVNDKQLRLTVNGQMKEQTSRCLGWAVAERGGARVVVAGRDFWQTYPKGIALKPDGIHVRLLPTLAEDEYKPRDINEWVRHLYWFRKGQYLFKRGMALKAEFWVRFDRAVCSSALRRDYEREAWAKSLNALPYAAGPRELYANSGAFGPLRRVESPEYEGMVERSVQRVLRNREEKGEYGWMNFGDWHGERTYNWGNSEYDWAWAMALQFARTGRWDYFEVGEQMTRHYSMVDTVHVPWSANMPGRVYAHSIGHVGAGVEPKEVGIEDARYQEWLTRNRGFFQGAIDPGGHIHQEGNFAYYFLTGDRDYLEMAEMVAGAQAAYLTARFDFGIERSAGWALTNAVAAYEATGKPFYLNAARLYVERILAKQDTVGGGWLLPQDRSECDHPPPHLGGKSFATGVLLYGLMRYDLAEPRPEVKRSIVRACEWLVEQAWNKEKQGFRYKTNCDKYADSADSGATMGLCSAGLAYGFTLQPDVRFQDVLRVGFGKTCTSTGGEGKSAAMLIRQSAYALSAVR